MYIQRLAYTSMNFVSKSLCSLVFPWICDELGYTVCFNRSKVLKELYSQLSESSSGGTKGYEIIKGPVSLLLLWPMILSLFVYPVPNGGTYHGISTLTPCIGPRGEEGEIRHFFVNMYSAVHSLCFQLCCVWPSLDLIRTSDPSHFPPTQLVHPSVY